MKTSNRENLSKFIIFLTKSANYPLFLQFMKTGFAILSTLLAAQGLAGNIDVNVANCQVNKEPERSLLSCPCVGGSGDYEWRFSELPEGWKADKDKLYVPQGKFEDRRAYGARVQVVDRANNESVKKSIYISFDKGEVNKVAEHSYDFDVSQLVSQKREKVVIFGGIRGAQNKSENDDKVKNLIEDCDNIGGGNGLNKLRPFFGGYGLYKGDDKNPFRDRLPTDQQVDKTIQKGSSKDIRQVIVNVVRSKTSCKNISSFLQKILLKCRNKIVIFKDDLEGWKKIISTLQEQISFLQGQLKDIQSNKVTIQSLTDLIEKLKKDLAQEENEKVRLQSQFKNADNQLDSLQANLSSLVQENRKIEDRRNQNINQISQIDVQIAQLQRRLAEANEKRRLTVQAGALIAKDLEQSNSSIAAIKLKIEGLRKNIEDLRARINQSVKNIQALNARIAEAQKRLKSFDNQKNSQTIKAELEQLQKKLGEAVKKLKQIEVIFVDFNKNYDDLSKIGDNNYNKCFREIFNQRSVQIKQVNNDKVSFKRFDLEKYIKSVFGQRIQENFRIRVPKPSTKPSTTPVTNPPTPTNPPKPVEVQKKQEKDDDVVVSRCTVFSPAWVKSYGNLLENKDKNKQDDDDDFECDSKNELSLKSFKGRIVRIQKNVAKVLDQNNEQCEVRFGGCSRIEVVNKPIPHVGDEIVWRGVERKEKPKSYNAHHAVCQ